MYEVFADLHIHIGRSESNKPIKITAARSLNFEIKDGGIIYKDKVCIILRKRN